MNANLKIWRAFLAVTSILGTAAWLSGCGGSPGLGATKTYLFFGTPLTAVDPDDPANLIAVNPPEIATANITAVQHAGYHRNSRMIYDRHARTVVFRKTANGDWWKVSALMGDGLVPTRLSNESAAATVCGAPVQKPDYQNHENARIVYRLPGPDAVCNLTDDVWKMLRLGMSESDSPVPAYSPVAAIHNSRTGALTGWLAKDGSGLFAYDAEFANPVLVSNFTAIAQQIAVAPDGIVFLQIDDKLHAYNPNTSPAPLSAPLHTIVSSLAGAVTDATHLYFGDDASIYRVPLDGSAAASLIVTEPDSGIYSMVLTDTRVVYTEWNYGYLRSVPKTGGAVTDLGVTWSLVGAAGSRVYFNTLVWGTPWWNYTAHVIDDDGSNYTAHTNAAWTPVQQDWAYFGATGTSIALGRMVLREGANAPPFTLKSYDAVTHTPIAALGTLPADMSSFYEFNFTRLPNQNNILVRGRSYAAPNQYDMLLLNTETADSLVRITDTVGDNESLVGASGCSIGTRAQFDPVFLLILFAALAGYRLRRARDAARAGTGP